MELFSGGENCPPCKLRTAVCWRHWRKSCQTCCDGFLASLSSACFFFVFPGSPIRHIVHRVWQSNSFYEPGISKRCFRDDKNLLEWLVAPAESVGAEASEDKPGKLLVLQVPPGAFIIMEVWETLSKYYFIHLIICPIAEGIRETKVQSYLTMHPSFIALKW